LRGKQKGKRMVLVTMRNSCNRDMLERSTHVYDFDPVFLDEALDRIITMRPTADWPDDSAPALSVEIQQELCDTVVECLARNGGTHSLRDVGRYLQASQVAERNALDLVRENYRNLRTFLDEWPDVFFVRAAFLNLRAPSPTLSRKPYKRHALDDDDADADLSGHLLETEDLDEFGDSQGENDGGGDGAGVRDGAGVYRAGITGIKSVGVQYERAGGVRGEEDEARGRVVRLQRPPLVVGRSDVIGVDQEEEEGGKRRERGRRGSDARISGGATSGSGVGVGRWSGEADEDWDQSGSESVEESSELSGTDEGLAEVIHPSVVPDLKLAQLKQLLREYGCAPTLPFSHARALSLCFSLSLSHTMGARIGVTVCLGRMAH
jgi:hypothetical protein